MYIHIYMCVLISPFLSLVILFRNPSGISAPCCSVKVKTHVDYSKFIYYLTEHPLCLHYKKKSQSHNAVWRNNNLLEEL